jgi:hypothetical protein
VSRNTAQTTSWRPRSELSTSCCRQTAFPHVDTRRHDAGDTAVMFFCNTNHRSEQELPQLIILGHWLRLDMFWSTPASWVRGVEVSISLSLVSGSRRFGPSQSLATPSFALSISNPHRWSRQRLTLTGPGVPILLGLSRNWQGLLPICLTASMLPLPGHATSTPNFENDSLVMGQNPVQTARWPPSSPLDEVSCETMSLA